MTNLGSHPAAPLTNNFRGAAEGAGWTRAGCRAERSVTSPSTDARRSVAGPPAMTIVSIGPNASLRMGCSRDGVVAAISPIVPLGSGERNVSIAIALPEAPDHET